MADSSLSVKVTADTVDLQAKLAVAKAEMAAWAAQARSAAKAVASAGIGTALTPQLLQASEGLINARTQVQGLEGALDKAGVHVTGLREIGAALHELSNGDVSRLPITFARLGETFFELGPIALGGLAGVTALGAGLFELAKHADEARTAMQLAEGAFIFGDNGNLRGSLDFVDQLKDKIASLPGVTQKSAGETVAAMASIKDAPQPLLSALAAGVPELTASFGSATKGIENFARGWNEIQEKGGDSNAFIQKFVEGLNLVEQRSGNAESTQQTLWETVQRGLAGVAVDAQSLETITSKLDASKVKEFGDALKAALGTGGTVTPKGDQLADFRVQVNQMEAAWKGSHVDMLAEAVSMWQGETKVARESDTQIREVANSLAEAQKSYNAAVASSAEQAQRKWSRAPRIYGSIRVAIASVFRGSQTFDPGIAEEAPQGTTLLLRVCYEPEKP